MVIMRHLLKQDLWTIFMRLIKPVKVFKEEEEYYA